MVGIPDGLGAFAQGKKVITYMNHELQATEGIVRAHGQRGAFVSRLEINPKTGEVLSGSDLIRPGVQYWDYLTSSYASAPNGAGVQVDGDVFGAYAAAFSRFCSGHLTAPGQLFNEASKAGYKGEIYFANEESGSEGRVFGVTKSGDAYQLPRLGLFSWENTLAAPNTSDTTLVMGNEDSSSGQIWAYVGNKSRSGNPIAKAGLSNGTNYVVDLIDEAVNSDAAFRASYGKGTPVPFDLSEVDWDQSGVDQNTDAAAAGLSLNRIEDGEFDPNNPNDYYFLTTEGAPFAGRDGGGLWKASFVDIERPQLGGTLTLVLDGSEAPFLNKPDNMTIDGHGNLLIQEDPGNNVHLARIVAYRISDGATAVVAQFDADLFTPGAAGFITADEESSGIIDTTELLGDGTFLFDAQVHAPTVNNTAEYVQQGQLLTMTVDDWDAVYGS